MALVQISTSVSKLGESIPTVNLPPIITCRPDAPGGKCAKEGGGCYAMRGHFTLPRIKNRLMENLKAYRENPKLFFEMLAHAFDNYKYARYFSSGDIVDEQFLKGMCWVARKCKTTKFLCFTKKYELVNKYIEDGHVIPKNLKIVFSAWRDFVPENPYNLPMTFVRFPGKVESNNLIPEKTFKCKGSCATCKKCWELKKGEVVEFKKH